MINIFFLILITIFLVPMLLLGGIVGRIFRPKGQRPNNSHNERRSTWHNTQTAKRKKRIEDNEGEYIDFEEIKEK